jgi:uncharacterized protein with FMN-binding domain
VSQKPTLGRQIFPAVALTVVGVGFISLLDNPGGNGGVALEGALGASTAPMNAETTTVLPEVTVEPSVVVPQTTLAPSPLVTVAPVVTPAPVDVTTTPSTQQATSATTCDGVAITGPVASFRWGNIQLRATFSQKNVLCKVKVLTYPSDHQKSIYINQNALPIYNQEAVAAGSANISVVSGATESWRAYTADLQAILDSHPAG